MEATEQAVPPRVVALTQHLISTISCLFHVSKEEADKIMGSESARSCVESMFQGDAKTIYISRSGEVMTRISIGTASGAMILIVVKNQSELQASDEHDNYSDLLHTLHVSDGSAIISLSTILENGLAPLVRAYVHEHAENFQSQGQQSVWKVVQGQMSELSRSCGLMEVRQNVPEVNLLSNLHPRVKELIMKSKEQSISPNSTEYLGGLETAVRDELLKGIPPVIEHWKNDLKLLVGAKPHESLSPAVYFGFWKEVLEKAKKVEGDLRSDEIRLSLEISHELSGTLHVTPFQEAMKMFQRFKTRVESIVERLGKLRLEEIESIVTIKELERRVNEIISYLTSHGQETDFLRDVNDYATRVLVSETFKCLVTRLVQSRFLTVTFSKFEELHQDMTHVVNLLKRNLPSSIPNIETTLNMKKRMDRILVLRKYHRVFRDFVSDPRFSEDLAKDLDMSYERFASVEEHLLDMSETGSDRFSGAFKVYESSVEKVEGLVANRLKARLKENMSSAEVMKVISKCSELPRLSRVLAEYKSWLYRLILGDLKWLEDMWLRRYSESDDARLSPARSLPANVASILWAVQLHNQAKACIDRLQELRDNDWKRILQLKGQENDLWEMDDSFAEFFGYSRAELIDIILDADRMRNLPMPIVASTFACSYLKIYHERSEAEWGPAVDQVKATQFQKCLVTDSNIDFLKRNTRRVVQSKMKDDSSELIERAEKLRSEIGGNTLSAITEWNKRVGRTLSDMKEAEWSKERILKVVKKKPYSELVVNFDHSLHQKLREISQMQRWWRRMDDEIRPPTVDLREKEVSQRAPIAVNLHRSLTLLQDTIGHDQTPLLLRNRLAAVEKVVQDGFKYSWFFLDQLGPYVEQLSRVVNKFVDDSHVILESIHRVENSVHDLTECGYSSSEFHKKFDAVREAFSSAEYVSDMDDKSAQGRKSLEKMQRLWADEINDKIEVILKARLEKVLLLWNHKNFFPHATNIEENIPFEQAKQVDVLRNLQRSFRVALKLASNKIIASPSIHDIRRILYERFGELLRPFAEIAKIKSKQQTRMLDVHKQSEKYIDVVLSQVPHMVVRCYMSIEEELNAVESFVSEWTILERFFVKDPSEYLPFQLTNTRDDVSMWISFVKFIRRAREDLEKRDTEREFGVVVVSLKGIQDAARHQLNVWYTEKMKQLRDVLRQEIKSLHEELLQTKNWLEAHDVRQSFSNVISFLSNVDELERKHEMFAKFVELFTEGEKLLKESRTELGNWWAAASLKSAFEISQKLFELNKKVCEEKKKQNKELVLDGHKRLQEETNKLCDEWNTAKPESVSPWEVTPAKALRTLNTFEGRMEELCRKSEQISATMSVLGIDVGIFKDEAQERLGEMRDLRDVWMKLEGVWEKVESLKRNLFSTIVETDVRNELKNMQEEIRSWTRQMRDYPFVVEFSKTIEGWIGVHGFIVSLRSPWLKTRHWRKLLSQLSIVIAPENITLGDMYKVDIRANESIFRDVISTAQGEFALEDFLNQTSSFWDSVQFEVVMHQERCPLIRGWGDLFERLNQDISSLRAMRDSPYFAQFREECDRWEERLDQWYVMLEKWVELQKKWLHLVGVFNQGADISHQLPAEWRKFQHANDEFVKLMTDVKETRTIRVILGVPQLDRSLTRITDAFNSIQRSLGEYLEKQRASFPRFYFVGDEDLLEVLGQAKDPLRIQRHLRKMFAGVQSFTINDNGEVCGVVSPQGEVLQFVSPIVPSESAGVFGWLVDVENQIRKSLASAIEHAREGLLACVQSDFSFSETPVQSWIEHSSGQAVLVASKLVWTMMVEKCIKQGTLGNFVSGLDTLIRYLANLVLEEKIPLKRKKIVNWITELVHQRDVCRHLVKCKVGDVSDYEWLFYLRFYFSEADRWDKRVVVRVGSASFAYGLEYVGVDDVLVQTPLTDRTYFTLTQALHARLGGSPFGPAGTGKTETVKALAAQLGRLVLVFNCDEKFDFTAMGRIFVGLCHCGAWGCFDEFNRLEERILSAVSQQIQTIQMGLRSGSDSVSIIDRDAVLSPETGIFVTMNPGYAGRRNLPDNLKQLFRTIAMVKPDGELIAQVMLYSQGFETAEILSRKIVPFFDLCHDQLSSQAHYDFGLRALKSVLASAGNLKRKSIQQVDMEQEIGIFEQRLLIQSVRETIVPKLIASDVDLLFSLLTSLFPGLDMREIRDEMLEKNIIKACSGKHLVPSEGFVDKAFQLHRICSVHHGVMLVGPSGCGKTSVWRILDAALASWEGKESKHFVIDPKAIRKEELFGKLDQTTREWTDGIFTQILRRIVDSGDVQKRHWIVFDGDVDPEWVENLNSVLDDNKLLTLPNGERIGLPPNVRLIFEVQDLKQATLATVSRCGMVWFSEGIVTPEMICSKHLASLESRCVGGHSFSRSYDQDYQNNCLKIVSPFLKDDSLVGMVLPVAEKMFHVMEFSRIRVLGSLFSLIDATLLQVYEYNRSREFPMRPDELKNYVSKSMMINVLWAFGGSLSLEDREQLGKDIIDFARLSMDVPDGNLLEYGVSIDTKDWIPWSKQVKDIEIEHTQVTSADLVVPTVDTQRHEHVVTSWLMARQPVILCGPPGSGKTMTLLSVVRRVVDMEVAFLSLSSASGPGVIEKTLQRYCSFVPTADGIVCRPTQAGKSLLLFCDEINLPAPDDYGTIRIITFLRQMVEHGGFYRPSDNAWIRLERIHFVGTCNPPTDPGRHALPPRFLRHCSVLLVDFPSSESLLRIYGTFNRAICGLIPSLRREANSVTNAMVNVYLESQKRFKPSDRPHYIYSPRELTRWVRGMYEVLRVSDSMDMNDFVRLWLHEGLRLFYDRLVSVDEKQWTDNLFDSVIRDFMPSVNVDATQRPVLFSNWLSTEYRSVNPIELREYIQARIRLFSEEVLDVELVVFDEVMDHILRIDRVLHQHLGHMLLVGVSGAGKTVLSRFVAWVNGMSVFQIRVHKKYSLADFEEDLRHVMYRAGVKGESICFVFDESNILESSFLEHMNALLASGDIPGLFDGEEYANLIAQCTELARSSSENIESADDVYQWFISGVQKNLHIIMTMNPANTDFSKRTATSPALFNRCVVDWFGEWSEAAMKQVALELTQKTDFSDRIADADAFPDEASLHDAVACAMVDFHQMTKKATRSLRQRQDMHFHLSPRHFLDAIRHFRSLYKEKSNSLVDQQVHMNRGLSKLFEAEKEVAELREHLETYESELRQKEKEASEKFHQILEDQKVAEAKKREAESMEEVLKEREKDVHERREVAYSDLQRVEPLVAAAKEAVSEIKKGQLDELRALLNPPVAVKLALQATCILIGKEKMAMDWDGIRRAIRDAEFIPSIVNFKTESVSPKQRKTMSRFLDDASFDFETANRGSKACGPLVNWVRAQCEYADIVHRVEPLRKEVERLEVELEGLISKRNELLEAIKDLEDSLERYDQEYGKLRGDAEYIKVEMSRVTEKMQRSESLLQSLSQERVRWQTQSEGFQKEMGTIVGDCLLSSAFLTYMGFFDEFYRHSILIPRWYEVLERRSLFSNTGLSLVEYLSTPSERMTWHTDSLANDELCVENAIILERFNQFPLVIDPDGQALRFIVHRRERILNGGRREGGSQSRGRVVKTSFLDPNFMNILKDAVKFGTTLVVEDVENIDPVLNPLLNREVQHTGGRVLVNVGEHEVDLSPSFRIYMITRDAGFSFPPDLSSRVTFANFTVTPSSLVAQCLHHVLNSERPDIEERRSEQLKLQGEYKVELRELEGELLSSLSGAQGNILGDETVIQHLEKLKSKSEDVSRKMEETTNVMEELTDATRLYAPFASSSSHIFFTLDRMRFVDVMYQFSLNSFLNMVRAVLDSKDKILGETEDADTRVQKLRHGLFTHVYRTVALSLAYSDQIPFACRLAHLAAQNGEHQEISEELLDFLLKGSSIKRRRGKQRTSQIVGIPSIVKRWVKGNLITADQADELLELRSIENLENLVGNMEENEEEWDRFIRRPNAEMHVPHSWRSKSPLASETKSKAAFVDALVIKVLRKDRLIFALKRYVLSVFGDDFLETGRFDLMHIVGNMNPCNPLLLCARPGYDPSNRVEVLAERRSKSLTSIAMGTAESFQQADKTLTTAARRGTWVLVKNVHLTPSWLESLEKRLHVFELEGTFHPNFRLFLSMEVNPHVPSNLIRRSRVLMFEPPPGMKAHLAQSMGSISAEKMDSSPRQRSRLHLMLSWLHAVVHERMRFVPYGWSKRYEFQESDLRFAIDMLNEWVDRVAGDRASVGPHEIPWSALRGVLIHCVYGGRMDNDYDIRVLQAFVNKLFRAESFEDGFELIGEQQDALVEALPVPEDTDYENMSLWVQHLQPLESPVCVGLQATAENLLRIEEGERTLHKITLLQSVYEDQTVFDASEFESTEEGPEKQQHAGSALWGGSRTWERVRSWLEDLPGDLLDFSSLKKDSIDRFLSHEFEVAQSSLSIVRNDLQLLTQVMENKHSVTNHVRGLFTSLQEDTLPSHWATYAVSPTLRVSAWLADFEERIGQLRMVQETLQSTGYLPENFQVWLGGLLFPQGFLTALRQHVSTIRDLSMEDLVLRVTAHTDGASTSGEDGQKNDNFIVKGLHVLGGSWESGVITPTSELSAPLPPMQFTWIHASELAKEMETSSETPGVSQLTIPVYRSRERSQIVCEITLPVSTHSISIEDWYVRGIAVILTNQS
eukprot:TRINITY_DN39309_c0_g2_i1.p1 TRINITY_DN39309_c0_g2~~TRINITY_DN39309_c0_g2_i1.p1  ORF type:complete len:4682 (+),score=1220.36 TRINITY_DN39309_c0_g2_i1:150-14195(+)